MRKAIIKINDKVHGPLCVGGYAANEYVIIEDVEIEISELEILGAIITEVKEPLVWEGEVYAYNNGAISNAAVIFIKNSKDLIGKRFHAKLTEIVEGAE